MSLTLLRSIIANKTYCPEKVVEAYLEWAYRKPYTYTNSLGKEITKNTRPFGMGVNTRTLFGQIKTVKTYIKRYNKKYEQSPWLTLNEGSKYSTLTTQSNNVFSNQANGTLMRLYPLAILPDNTRELATIIDCNITNPSVVNIDCSLYAVRVLRHLLLGKTPKEALMSATKLRYHSSDMTTTVQNALDKKPRDILSGGWVLHSIYVAIRTLNEFNRYDLAMDWIIKQGGDTDTNASIAGAWLGASIGYKALLIEGEQYKLPGSNDITTRNKYNFNHVLNATTLDGDYPRPEKYRLQDFHQLVASAVELNS